MNVRNLYTCCSLFLALSIYSASGQESRYVRLSKASQELVGHSTITRILQDTYGFLWVATQDGVCRYDGKTVIKFGKQSVWNRRLDASLITDIVEDTMRRQLWVTGSHADVYCIDERTATLVERLEGNGDGIDFSRLWIRSVSVQGDLLWIGYEGGLTGYDIRNKRFMPPFWTTLFGGRQISVAKLFSDRGGNLWGLCEGTGIFLLDPRKKKIVNQLYSSDLNTRKRPDKLRFWDCTASKETLYIACNWGLLTFNLSTFTSPKWVTLPISNNIEVLSCYADKKDVLWLSTMDNFYSYQPSNGVFIRFTEEKREREDWFTLVYQTFADHSGNIWIGSQDGLASFRAKESMFNTFFMSATSHDRIKHAYRLLPMSDSLIYCGDENGLFKIRTGDRDIKKIDTAGAVYMLMKDRRMNVFVSNKNGLSVLRSGDKLVRASSIFPELLKMDGDQLNSGIDYNDSISIFCSIFRNGVYRWNRKKRVVDVFNNELGNFVPGTNIITNSYCTRDGKVFLLSEGFVIEFNPLEGKFDRHAIRNYANGLNLMDMAETNNGYWFGFYGNGVIETDKALNLKRIFTTATGLCNNAVNKLVSYHDSLIVATTNDGMSIINSSSGFVRNFYSSDGLHGNNFEQFCATDFNGRIYVGGVNGFTIINPALFSENKVPPTLYISGINIKTDNAVIDTSDLAIASFEIPNHTLQTTLYFSAINYSNPERTDIEYKFEGKHGQWVRIGKDNSLPLIGVAPGKYKLMARALNEDGIASKTKEINLVFLPEWYQTAWFKSGVALIILGILYAFYKMRIGQLQKENQIRAKLASDLHDDLGSTMNSVKVYANLALLTNKSDKYLLQIKENTQEAITAIRDMIWVLDDKKDTAEDLISKVNAFAIPLVEATGMQFVQDISYEARKYKMAGEEKRNVYMIMKEAINNAVKYAGGNKIFISLDCAEGKLLIRIKDFGTGFDLGGVREGNGIRNMRRRATTINYSIDIATSPISGTDIRIRKK